MRGSGFNRAEFDTVRGGEWIKAVRGRRLSRRFLFVCINDTSPSSREPGPMPFRSN